MILIGNLGGDPKITETANGTPVANMRIYVRILKKRGEEWDDSRSWWASLNVYGNYAKNCDTLKKGMGIQVEPNAIYPETYKTKNGTERHTIVIEASRVGADLGRVENIAIKDPKEGQEEGAQEA